MSFAADTMDSGVCHMAHFADPDGNVLMLHNRYAPGARVTRATARPQRQAASCASALSTSSSCVFGEAFGMTCAMTPLASTMNVARCAPM